MTECLRCGRCCVSFGVCVTPFDIARISKATGKDPIEFVMRIDEPQDRERQEPAIVINKQKSLIVLKWKVRRVCVFYSSSGCKIYDSRPMLCRTYPFVIRKKLVEMGSRACPRRWYPRYDDMSNYVNDCRVYEKELASYQRMADEWNRNGGGTLREFLDYAVDRATVLKINDTG